MDRSGSWNGSGFTFRIESFQMEITDTLRLTHHYVCKTSVTLMGALPSCPTYLARP